MRKPEDDDSESLSTSFQSERRKKWFGSMITVDTVDDILSPSLGSDTSEQETEDYFTKFNALSGWQLFVLVQFQLQTRIFIIIGIYLAYINCVLDAATALRANNTDFHDVMAIRGKRNTLPNLIEFSIDCL